MQDTLPEGTPHAQGATQLAPSAVTAGAVGGSANRSVVGRVSPTMSGSSNAAQSPAPCGREGVITNQPRQVWPATGSASNMAQYRRQQPRPQTRDSSTLLKLRAQLVLALLLVLVLVLVLSMLVHRALIVAISMLVPLLHAAPSGRRQQLHQARAWTPVALSNGRRPMVNRSDEPDLSEGESPYVDRPIDEAALLAYALQVYREPPPQNVSVLAESRRWTWWWAGRPLQVCN